MTRMLKGVPVQPLRMPDGVVAVGSDWRYREWADGGFVARVGKPTNVPAAPAAPAADPAASAPR